MPISHCNADPTRLTRSSVLTDVVPLAEVVYQLAEPQPVPLALEAASVGHDDALVPVLRQLIHQIHCHHVGNRDPLLARVVQRFMDPLLDTVENGDKVVAARLAGLVVAPALLVLADLLLSGVEPPLAVVAALVHVTALELSLPARCSGTLRLLWRVLLVPALHGGSGGRRRVRAQPPAASCAEHPPAPRAPGAKPRRPGQARQAAELPRAPKAATRGGGQVQEWPNGARGREPGASAAPHELHHAEVEK
mmetsp:Transcript_69923/g.218231  ORF Transcript_69923/g.218231 Transcript_69923/m.218231 type:complete len:250 (-) Transcript_69923:139-888(-)